MHSNSAPMGYIHVTNGIVLTLLFLTANLGQGSASSFGFSWLLLSLAMSSLTDKDKTSI